MALRRPYSECRVDTITCFYEAGTRLAEACTRSLDAGREKLKIEPEGVACVAHSRPPCAGTIERQIASPMPMPLGLVVKNGSIHVSEIRHSDPDIAHSNTTLSSCCAEMMASSRRPFMTGSIASIAFRTRFESTCCNWTRSASTAGQVWLQFGSQRYRPAAQVVRHQTAYFLDHLVGAERDLVGRGMQSKACRHVSITRFRSSGCM